MRSNQAGREAAPGRTAGASYHHGDLPAALFDAVQETIRERGVGGLSLREVARRVGVSHAAPAHHFHNKAGLLTAFATDGYARLAQTVIAEITASVPTDGAALLAAVGRGYVRFALANREQFEVMFRLDLVRVEDPDFVAASEAAYSLLLTTIEQCRQEGRLGDNDPEVVAVGAWSLVHGFAALWLSGRLPERISETDPHRLAASIATLYVQSVLSIPWPSSEPVESAGTDERR
jgi:AcrR family transcriptional regulator